MLSPADASLHRERQQPVKAKSFEGSMDKKPEGVRGRINTSGAPPALEAILARPPSSSSLGTSTESPARPRSGSEKELSSSPVAASPLLSRGRRDSLLASLDDEEKAALLHELPEESKEALRKKSEKLLKKELEKKMKVEERNSKKIKKKEQDEVKLAKKFQITLEEVKGLINTYRCAYHKTGIIHHGKIYVFPGYICFTSSSGLTTAKIVIAEIQSITLKVINAIQILTAPPDFPKGKKYYFSHWHHRERAFKSFSALWRYAQGDTTINIEDLKDSMKVKTLSFQDDGKTNGSGLGGSLSGSQMSLDSSMDDISVAEDLQSDFEMSAVDSSAHPAQAEEENVVLPPVLDAIQYVPPHASKSPDASAVLEVSLKQFWKIFFADPKFYSDVHYAKGDRVARTGEWSAGEGGFYVRPHYFEQEIKSKLMKGKICKVDQTQQACLVNEKRFLFGTDSRMEGVPYASDFTVKTYWEVCEERPQLVNIHVWLWVDWIKVPFGLKGTIERGSINGVKEHFESFISDARSALVAKKAEGGNSGEGGDSAQLPSTLADHPSTPASTTATQQQQQGGNASQSGPSSTVQTTLTPVSRTTTTATQEKGLAESFLKDPTRLMSLVAVLVVLLAAFTYFFLSKSTATGGDGDLRILPVLPADETMRVLVDRWQADLDAIRAHLREVHALMDKLHEEMTPYRRP